MCIFMWQLQDPNSFRLQNFANARCKRYIHQLLKWYWNQYLQVFVAQLSWILQFTCLKDQQNSCFIRVNLLNIWLQYKDKQSRFSCCSSFSTHPVFEWKISRNTPKQHRSEPHHLPVVQQSKLTTQWIQNYSLTSLFVLNQAMLTLWKVTYHMVK